MMMCDSLMNVEVQTRDAECRLKMRTFATTASELKEILQELNKDMHVNNECKELMRQKILKLCASNPPCADYLLLRSMTVRCYYDYICVIDFEATCIESKEFYPHEIIEFPAALIDPNKLSIVDTFHSFVKPTLLPELSAFCKNFTGISQKTVNEAETFETVLTSFISWIDKHCESGKTFAILTDGSSDIDKFLILQCLISQIDFPVCATNWIDIKTVYKRSYKMEKTRLNDMIQSFGMQFKGRQHSGKDDTYNIAQLAIAMLKDGCKFKTNSSVSRSRLKVLKNRLTSFIKARKDQGKKMNTKPVNQHVKKKLHSVESCSEFVMDVDPELVGTEITLSNLKLKSK